MRVLATLALVILALTGCDRPQGQAAAGCAHEVSREVAWSGAEPDTITASSSGPTCLQAFVTLSIRNAAGDALWIHAGTYYDMVAGGVPPSDAAAVTSEQMETFLANWAEPTLGRTGALPEWRAAAATLTESASVFAYDTPFDRDTYEQLRARDLPTLCYAAAVEATQCLIIDPLSNAPTMIVAYGP
jgi:hypothetical protein